jgi:FKBP-type peptidyl-prolyl cis-trans isomerase
VGTSIRKNRNTLREEMIAKKITEIFKDKDTRMIRTIEQTIYEDRLKIYKQKRAEYDQEFAELEAEKKKVLKKKKSKKERNKILKGIMKHQFIYIVRALNSTVLHYKE